MSALKSLLPLVAIAAPALADIHAVTVPSGFFNGAQSGIGSWYQANTGSSNTNGQSWCGYSYSNSDPVFAVSLKAMGGQTYNSNPSAWKAATQKYCGLEARVTDPATGKSMLMYLGDSFDDQYVRTPSSIDIMINGFTNLNGNPNGNHNIVINPVNWQWTGNVNTRYAGPGASWPTAATTAKPTATTAKPSTATCDWGCLGWDCGPSVPCQSPNVCVNSYCRASSATSAAAPTSTCDWGCWGWDCSDSVPCQSPNVCVSNYCRSATAASAAATSSPAPGSIGASCDGKTVTCNSGLTCLAPNGVCSDQACNWGCNGWTCSASSPCQAPNTCVSGYCRAQ